MAQILNANILEKADKYQSVTPKNVLNAVKLASQKTGVDFSYLMEKASAESAFDTDAKAKTSSATGLFQFIDKTWLSMIKENGAKYGFEKYANNIDNPKMRQEILDLRKDPKASALMAAEFTKDNQNYIESKLGRKANATDLYMAHFLGAGGATKFLQNLESNPNKDAKDLLPNAAKANKPVFYEDGNARSVKEIYAMFSKKFDTKIDNISEPIAKPIVVAENTITEKPAYYGRISAPTGIPYSNNLSSEMLSILYDLSTTRSDYKTQNDKDNNLSGYPAPGFFV